MNPPEYARQWWRWLLIPIAAPVSAIFVVAAVAGIQYLFAKIHGGIRSDGWYWLFVMPAINLASLSYTATLVTGLLAPTGKTIAAVVITTVLSTIALMQPIFYFSFDLHDSSLTEHIQVIVTTLAIIIGGILGVCHIHDESRE